MKSNATKGNRIQPNTTKYKEMQGNSSKYNPMQPNVPNATKYNQMQPNVNRQNFFESFPNWTPLQSYEIHSENFQKFSEFEFQTFD